VSLLDVWDLILVPLLLLAVPTFFAICCLICLMLPMSKLYDWTWILVKGLGCDTSVETWSKKRTARLPMWEITAGSLGIALLTVPMAVFSRGYIFTVLSQLGNTGIMQGCGPSGYLSWSVKSFDASVQKFFNRKFHPV